MAVTNIQITQDNKVGSVDLLATDSPLVFIVEVTYTGAAPEIIYVEVIDGITLITEQFKAVQLDDPTVGLRRFFFVADGIIRGLMGGIDDTHGSSGITEIVADITRQFFINFKDPDSSLQDDTYIVFARAARQFGENPCMTDVSANEDDLVIGLEAFPTPVYFYWPQYGVAVTPKDIEILPGTPGTTQVNSLGNRYFRKIFTNLTDGNTIAVYTVDLVQQDTKTIRVKNPCGDYKVLKYLDKNGQYRIYPFNKEHVIQDKPDKIGDTNEIFTSILTQTNSKNIGYRNERQIILTADAVPADELELLADLGRSPRVYYYIGTAPSNLASDWVLIKDIDTNGIVKQAKKNFTDITVTVTLPETFNISML